MEEKPKDISEVFFFTRQPIENKGFAFMWVYKPICPECNKARLKKLKKRDKNYACEACKKTFEPKEHDALLKYNLEYTCPECEHKGTDFGEWTSKPKSKTSTIMLRFICENCKSKLKVARMGKKKKKKN